MAVIKNVGNCVSVATNMKPPQDTKLLQNGKNNIFR